MTMANSATMTTSPNTCTSCGTKGATFILWACGRRAPVHGRTFSSARCTSRDRPESAGRRPRDRQRFDAVDERRQQPGGLAGRDDIGYFAVQFFEHDPDFPASQVGAQAEVRAASTEADMRVGITGHVEHPRVGELRLVAIG